MTVWRCDGCGTIYEKATISGLVFEGTKEMEAITGRTFVIRATFSFPAGSGDLCPACLIEAKGVAIELIKGFNPEVTK